MKFLFPLLSIVLCTGCMQTRSITEEYIKNYVEEHVPGSRSAIRTYSIYKSQVTSTSTTYLELTGYKYKGTKGLVIGADRYYRHRAKLTGLPVTGAEVTYITLSMEECEALLAKEAVMRTAIKIADKPIYREEVYEDYTVNDELFISYRKYPGKSTPMWLDIWIKGSKYPIPKTKFLDRLKRFMAY